MLGCEDHTRNEDHCGKIWRVQKRMKGKDPISRKGIRREENLPE
jgi:hypothetical protein